MFDVNVSFMARPKEPDPFARSGWSPAWLGDVDFRLPILIPEKSHTHAI